jgi:hypothetical protein
MALANHGHIISYGKYYLLFVCISCKDSSAKAILLRLDTLQLLCSPAFHLRTKITIGHPDIGYDITPYPSTLINYFFINFLVTDSHPFLDFSIDMDVV